MPTKIQDCKGLSVCINNHVFKSNEVRLIPFSAAEKECKCVLYTDSDYVIKRREPVDLEFPGFLLACPVCNVIQIDGFRNAPTNSTPIKGVDNTIPERRLEIDL
jgi:hypothetical protein